MEAIRSVRITRSENQVVAATYLKEFFIFSGVYVSEKILNRVNNSRNRNNDKIRLICNDKGSPTYIKNNMDLMNENKRQKFGNEALIKGISARLGEEFQILSEIFIKRDCAYKNYFGRLYFKQMEKEEGKNLAEFYKDCFEDLYKESESHSDYLHLKFAYLNCARKSNEVYDACNIQTLFDEKKLIEKAKSLLEQDFFMAKVLIGEIGLSLRILWDEGEVYLKEAMQDEEKKEYSSFIYYRLGHFYEIEKEDLNKAEKIYLKIKEFEPKNYRMLFKLGWISYYTNELDNAVKYFEQVYNLVEEKGMYIQPVEMEYKWKCAFILANSKLLKERVKDIGKYKKELNEVDLKNEFIKNDFFISRFVVDKDREKFYKYFEKKIDKENLKSVVS